MVNSSIQNALIIINSNNIRTFRKPYPSTEPS